MSDSLDAIAQLVSLENKVGRLEAENKWLREMNRDLREELKEAIAQLITFQALT